MKTNSNNINNSKSSKTKSIIALTSLIIVLSIVNITLLTGTIFGININTTTNASALSYSTSEDVSFTFKPTLSIGLSTNNLTIDNLVPGTTSDSNTVTVTVSSNTPYGYVLSAGVGSTVSTDPYYNTSDLVHDNSTTQVPTTNKFSSISTSASLANLTTDNTWGYSTSTDGGTSWSTYSGLSHTAAKPLLDISDPATPSTIDFKIAARSATTQASGAYNNVITFYAVGKPEPLTIYEEVAKMSKGVQTTEDFQTAITTPTSKDYHEDTSNSGVYEYNSDVFGESSDASNANKIYYYRGKLEPDYTQYGTNGQATTYPNFVKLDNDTCWRIVRTTGSGGVKIIYHGTWDGSTCVAAQLTNSSFNGTKNTTKQVVLAGYTYDSKYASNSITNRTLATLFGTNESNNNTTDSTIKTNTENWYATNLYSYSTILEPSAGYCNDRTVYVSGVLQDESFSTPQYTSKDTGEYQLAFGSLYSSYRLGCPSGREKVDLYTTPLAENGNNQLRYPIAHLTRNEAYLTGLDGRHNNSRWLGSSFYWWLLSPGGRYTNVGSSGNVQGTTVLAESRVEIKPVYSGFSIRPVISLVPGTTAESGSGTATDPWVVPAP